MGYNTYMSHGIECAPPKLKCSNQVRCKNGSADFNEVMNYIIRTLKDCIADFEVLVDNDQSDSVKLHEELVKTLEVKLSELETKELKQWEALHDPDPAKQMPQQIFQKLNDKLLIEKDEIKKALCEAKSTMPRPVNYEEKIMKFTEVLEILQDPDVSAKIKNQYLRDIIERIDYSRPPNVKITKKNATRYGEKTGKGMRVHTEPFKLKITLK